MNQQSFVTSRYVQTYELGPDRVLLANLLWRTYLEFTDAEAAYWANIKISGDVNSAPETVREKLASKRMILEASVDELAMMDAIYNERRFSSDALGLTIAPTIDCNFACPYCYEDKRPGRITPEVEQQILAYVERYLPGRKLLNIIWYGGEPLMCKDAIYRLSDAFVRLAELNKCAYKVRMVTNGYLLTPDVADRLFELGHWGGIQITLDGTATYHDLKRPLRSGKPTFERVYRNLLYASTKLPISLRMNVDLMNPDGCHDLLDDLAGAGAAERIFVYFAPIHSFGKGCRDIDDKPEVQLSSTVAFSEIQTGLMEHALDLGFATTMPFEMSHLPQCQATSTHSVVIEPDGGLHRCWIEVGEDHKRVGHIAEAIDLSDPLSTRWLKFHPVRNDPCRSCEVLPLCFGGCPQRHLDGAPMELVCNSIRYNTKEMVLAEYLTQHGIKLDRAKSWSHRTRDDQGQAAEYKLSLPVISLSTTSKASCDGCKVPTG
jgi:uncharacterized protein